MSIKRVVSGNRVLAAAVVTATAIGVPGSALAIGSAVKGPKPSSVPAATSPVSKAQGLSDLSGLASSAGITVSRLQSGLIAAKQAGGNSASAVAAFARATGVSPATAHRVVYSVFGANVDRSPTSAAAVAALATQLRVSEADARSALLQIGELGRAHGVDPTSPAFAAIAHRLGVSPTALAAALPLVKQAESAAGG
jgi:hypothetical protein